jgi:hypothetical protein
MRQNVLQIDPYATTDVDSIATSQTPAAGGEQALTINGAFASGGVATLDTPRQVVFTFAADETGKSFLVTGTRRDGKQLVEAVAGTAALATTVQAFATVTEILIDQDSAGAISVGTTLIVSTSWFPMDYIRNPVNVGMVITIGGATNVTVELTLSNLMSRRGNDPLPTVGHHVGSKFKLIYPVVNAIDHDTLVNVAADTSGNIAFPVTGLRLTSNAVVVTTPVILEVVQAGHRGA